MNTAEKKRAEEMVKEALGKGPVKADYVAVTPEAPAALIKRVRDTFKAVEAAGFRISRNYNGTLDDAEVLPATSDHPTIVAANRLYEAAQQEHTARQRTIIAKVWGDEFDFGTLRVELSK